MPTDTANSASATATEAAETTPARSSGLAGLGAQLDAFLGGTSGSEDAGGAANDADGAAETEVETDPEETVPTGDAGQPAEQIGTDAISSDHLSVARRAGLTEEQVRAIPAGARDSVLGALRKQLDVAAGLTGRLKQLSPKPGQAGGATAGAGQTAQTTQPDAAIPGTDSGADNAAGETGPQADPLGGFEPIPALDLDTLKTKLALNVGDEAASDLVEAFKPVQRAIEAINGTRQSQQQSAYRSLAEQAEQFFNSEENAAIYGKDYDSATDAEKGLRVDDARAALTMLKSGLATDWPTALRKARNAAHAEALQNRAVETVRGTVAKRSRSVTPAPSRLQSGQARTQGAEAGLASVASILDGMLGRGE